MQAINKSITFFLLFISVGYTCSAQRYKEKIFTEVDTTKEIKYGAAMNSAGQMQDLVMDFYAPKNDVLTKRPLLIYVHGGGFNTGDKNILHINGLCDQMAKRGYVVANINYRLDPNFDIYKSNTDRRAMIDAMHDAKAAVRFLRKNADIYGIDTNFIVIGGESAGAATSMLVSYVDEQSELLSYPMASPNTIEGNSGNPGYSSKTDYTLCLCGLMLDTLAINTGDQPLLWMHGTEDNFVPYSLAKIITTRAKNLNLDYTEYTFTGGIHCPWYTSAPNWLQYLDTTINLITNFLYPKVTATLSESKSISKFNVFPNPVYNSLTISGSQSEIRLYNQLGQQQATLKEENHKMDRYLDVANLKPGLYYLRSNDFAVKFVKE